MDGGLISNNTITNVASKEATVKVLPSQVSATTDAAQWAIISSQSGFWTYPSNWCEGSWRPFEPPVRLASDFFCAFHTAFPATC
jgi:hypothetical protein